MEKKRRSRLIIFMAAASAAVVVFACLAGDCHAEIKLLSKFGGDVKRPTVVYAKGDIAYTFGIGGDIRVWDISDTKNVRQINKYTQSKDRRWQAKSDEIKFEGYHGNAGGVSQTYTMAIADFGSKRFALVMAFHQSLQFLNITDPYRIYNMGSRPELNAQSGNSNCIKVKGKYIFQTSWGGFKIFKYDRTAALIYDGAPYEFIASMDYYGSSEAREYSRDIEVPEGMQNLYVAKENSLDVYDLFFIDNPKRIFRYGSTGYSSGGAANQGTSVKLHGKLLFFGTLKDLRVFDVSDPAAPQALKSSSGADIQYPSLGPVLDIGAYKDYVFLYYGPTKEAKDSPEIGIEVVDVSNPCDPKFIESFSLGATDTMEYQQGFALAPEKGIAIVPGKDAFYVLDVSEYTSSP